MTSPEERAERITGIACFCADMWEGDQRCKTCRIAAEIRSAVEEERERWEPALKRIEDDGCGLLGYDGRPECVKWGDDQSEWCWSCIAKWERARAIREAPDGD